MSTKNNKIGEETGKCDLYTGGEKVQAIEGAQMLDLADKNFKAAIINMFREFKETMSQELKGGMMTGSNQMENITEKMQTIKESQMGILELESITKMKNSLARLNSRLQLTEES